MKIKKWVVLKSEYNAIFDTLELKIDDVCDNEDQAHAYIEKVKEEHLQNGMEETGTNLALSLYNPLNEQEYIIYEIQEIEA